MRINVKDTIIAVRQTALFLILYSVPAGQ